MRITEKVLLRTKELLDAGMSWSEIPAQFFGMVSQTALKTAYYKRIKGIKGKKAAAFTDEVTKMRKAAAKATGQSEAKITCLWEGGEKVDMAETWRRAEDDAAEEIDRVLTHSKFIAELPSNRVQAITFISDQHIAPGTPCDFKRMREDAELISKTRDVHAILGGDSVDNHIKHLAAMLSARSRPQEQFLLFEHYLQIFRERILCVTSGNHCLWTLQLAGIDMISWICQHHKIAYAPNEARILVKLGKQEYRIAIRHQYRFNSSFNMGHCVRQWLRMGEEEFDVGCIGHHHEACVDQMMYRGKVVWACRPGAYQMTSGYGSQYGFNNATPTCPTFLLFPDKRYIIGLHDIVHVPAVLRAFNG